MSTVMATDTGRSATHAAGEACHSFLAYFSEHRVASIDPKTKATTLRVLGQTVQNEALNFINDNAVLPLFSMFHISMSKSVPNDETDLRHIRIHWTFGFIPFGQYQLHQLG